MCVHATRSRVSASCRAGSKPPPPLKLLPLLATVGTIGELLPNGLHHDGFDFPAKSVEAGGDAPGTRRRSAACRFN